MRDLGQQVVHHVRADIVVDLVEDAVVAVQRGEAAAQVAPLLRTTARSAQNNAVPPSEARVLQLCITAATEKGRSRSSFRAAVFRVSVALTLHVGSRPLRAAAHTWPRYQGTASCFSSCPWWCRYVTASSHMTLIQYGTAYSLIMASGPSAKQPAASSPIMPSMKRLEVSICGAPQQTLSTAACAVLSARIRNLNPRIKRCALKNMMQGPCARVAQAFTPRALKLKSLEYRLLSCPQARSA